MNPEAKTSASVKRGRWQALESSHAWRASQCHVYTGMSTLILHECVGLWQEILKDVKWSYFFKLKKCWVIFTLIQSVKDLTWTHILLLLLFSCCSPWNFHTCIGCPLTISTPTNSHHVSQEPNTSPFPMHDLYFFLIPTHWVWLVLSTCI